MQLSRSRRPCPYYCPELDGLARHGPLDRIARGSGLQAALINMLPPAWVPVLLASALQVGESAVEQMEGLRAGADDGRGAAGGCCSGPVAVAECWGWSPTNATLNTLSIQSSLDCEAASTVRVPKMPGPWVVAPPHGSGELDFAPPTGSGKIWRVAALNFSRASDKLVIFEAGCVVQAERWSFHEVRAPLAVIGSLWGLVRNLTIVGEPGARWEMWKADYQNVSCDRSSSRSTSRTCFAVSEWRHGLSIWWAHDLIVSGLTIANSGGSGVSLGGMEGLPYRLRRSAPAGTGGGRWR